MDLTETPTPAVVGPDAPPTAQIPAQTVKPPIDPPTQPTTALVPTRRLTPRVKGPARHAEPTTQPVTQPAKAPARHAKTAVQHTPIYDQLAAEQLIDPVKLSAEIATGLAEYRDLLSQLPAHPPET